MDMDGGEKLVIIMATEAALYLIGVCGVKYDVLPVIVGGSVDR